MGGVKQSQMKTIAVPLVTNMIVEFSLIVRILFVLRSAALKLTFASSGNPKTGLLYVTDPNNL